MSVKPDGGPAFPTHGGNDYDDPRNKILVGGMTLRDWFAGQALAGIAAGYWGNPEISGVSTRILSGSAYEFADAMIAARDAE